MPTYVCAHPVTDGRWNGDTVIQYVKCWGRTSHGKLLKFHANGEKKKKTGAYEKNGEE